MTKIGIVLGLYVLPNGKPDLASRLRVERAVDMLHAGQLTRLIFTGGKNPFTFGRGRKTTEALAMVGHAEKYARAIGLPNNKWNFTSENASRNTAENARNCLSTVTHYAPSTVVIFTHPQHAQRAKRIFEQHGYVTLHRELEVIGVPVKAQRPSQRPTVRAFNAIVDRVEAVKHRIQMR